MASAKKLQKLPMQNQTLQDLAALDPCHSNEASSLPALMRLAERLPNVIESEDLGALDAELRLFTSDEYVIKLQSTSSGSRIDTDFWNKIFQCASYPCLSKLVKALLSIFSGPIVEGTFNIMDDIMRKDRTSMDPHTYEAMATIKHGLKRRKVSGIDLPLSKQMRVCMNGAYSKYQDHLKTKKRD